MPTTKRTTEYCGAGGYALALQQSQRQRGALPPEGHFAAAALPLDLQRTAGQLEHSLERIRALPISRASRPDTVGRSNWTLAPSNSTLGARMAPSPGRERAAALVSVRSRALSNAGPAFAEFCKQQEERREQHRQRAAALAQDRQPVLRSQSLQELLEPPAKAAPNARALRHQDAITRSRKQTQTAAAGAAPLITIGLVLAKHLVLAS